MCHNDTIVSSHHSSTDMDGRVPTCPMLLVGKLVPITESMIVGAGT